MADLRSTARIVALGAASDIGLRRSKNEDSFRALDHQGLWLVADGMGGPGGGDIASQLAVEHVEREVGHGADLKDASQRAHEAILEAAAEGRGRPGMGTTLVAVQGSGQDYRISWIGDSRGYLWNGGLKRLTHDHSVVQALIDAGQITEDEARYHPERNIITRVLGGGTAGSGALDQRDGRLADGEKILLCSDGLTAELEDARIAEIMDRPLPGPGLVEALIDAALRSGGSDNVTVVLIGLGEA